MRVLRITDEDFLKSWDQEWSRKLIDYSPDFIIALATLFELEARQVASRLFEAKKLRHSVFRKSNGLPGDNDV